MNIDSLAQALFGSKRAETQEVSTDGTTRTYAGVALTDSEDGTVVIDLGGDVTLPDDLYDEDGNVVAEWDGVGVEMPTSPQVSAGDDVIVTLMGGSSTKTPMVTSSAGSGDRMRALVNAAQTVADAAQAVAEAVNQHFWHDTNGAHVTMATQDEWEQEQSGPNSLWNALGMLFRDGLNNLLTLTTESGARALTIWDGLGNSASNILARFSSDGISFADGTSFDIGDSSSYIHFDGNGHINIGGSGLTIGGYATNADVADAIDGISVGGRNLVWDTAWNDVANRWTAWGSPTTREIVEMDGKRWLHLVTTTTKFQGYQQRPDKRAGYGEIQAGDTLTISFTAYATVATSDNISCIGVHWLKSDGSIYGQTWITTELTTVPKRFVKTVSIVDGAPVVGFNIMVGDNSAVARELWISEVKLEKGNTATDWSPAPEDVDNAISDAAKTATSYVTEITGQNGIMVHPSTDQTTGVQITDDVDILRNGTSVAEYGETVRIGAESSDHVEIDSNELMFHDGTNAVMQVGSSCQITEKHVCSSSTSEEVFYLSLKPSNGAKFRVIDKNGEIVTSNYTLTRYDAPDEKRRMLKNKSGTALDGETVLVFYQSSGMVLYDEGDVSSTFTTDQASLAGGMFEMSYKDTYSSVDGTLTDSTAEISMSKHRDRHSSISLNTMPNYNRSYMTFQTVRNGGFAGFVLDSGSTSNPDRVLDLIYLDKIRYIDPYSNYKVLGSPTRLNANKSMTLTNTSGWTDGPSVDLTQGHWLVVGVACFNTGSSSGVRKLRAQLRLGTSVYAEGTEINVANNDFGRVEAVAIMSASSATTATLVLNSGMTFTTAATSYITAILLT